MLVHLTQNQVEDYLQLGLSGPELLTLSDHLALCEPCRKKTVARTDASFLALHAEVLSAESETLSFPDKYGHLTAEEIGNYVDGQQLGDDPGATKDHLIACEECSLAVEDLRGFRNLVAANLDREYAPAIGVATERRPRRLLSFLPNSWRQPRLALASALTVLLLVLTGWLIWQAQRKTEAPRSEMALATPTPIPATPDTRSVTAVDSSAPAGDADSIVAELKDGEGSVKLDRDGNLSGADTLPPVYQRKIRQALRTQHIEKSALLAGLNRPESSLMTTDEQAAEFSVSEPTGKVTLSDRPTFQWTPLPEATAYVIEIYDENFNLVTASAPVTAVKWTVGQPLSRGHTYSWQVKATKAGQEFRAPRPPARQAKFRVLDGDKADELRKAQRAYSSSHLTMGLLYADAGLLDQAEREFRALQKANPQSPVVKKLLNQVHALQK